MIHLLGDNVTELDLMVYGRFDFTSSFVKAVGRLKHLKILVINHEYAPRDNKPINNGEIEPVNNDQLDIMKNFQVFQKRLDERQIELKEAELVQSEEREEEQLAALLDAIPSLEYLTIGYEELKPMNFASKTLSNLRYFCFTYSEEGVEGITCICEQAKDTLKAIEYFSAAEDCEELGPAFEVLRETLEGVFVISAYGQVPGKIAQSVFPRLRVLRTESGTEQFFHGAFPDWPMLRTIRTLIMDLHYVTTNECLDYPQHLPNLKQMVFYPSVTDKPLDDNLVEEFDACGIKCHLISEDEANSCNMMVSLRKYLQQLAIKCACTEWGMTCFDRPIARLGL